VAAETTTRAAGKPEYRVESLAKGLRVLSLFSERRTTVRLSEVAAETGIPLPTVYRVAVTLVAEGFLEQLADGAYRPGVKVLTLGFAALRSMDLVDLARAPLRRLAESTGETVNLVVLSGDKVLYLIRNRNADLVTANIQVGSTLPAVYTSTGKLLLAHLSEQDLRLRITEQSFAPGAGPNATRSLQELLPMLRTALEQGWATQDEELAYGLRSIAAPIHEGGGRVIAAANVAVRSTDWPHRRIVDELRPPLSDACEEISSVLRRG
jgi:IclR family pca regulon transcriptional regulator